jgi:hypothetical protein
MTVTDRAAFRELEAGVRRAEDRRHTRYLGRAVHRRRVPLVYNLRMDPYERADVVEYLLGLVAPQTLPAHGRTGARRGIHRHLKDYPPAAPRASVDQIMEKLQQPTATDGRLRHAH